jgi:hypothetical protein
MNLGQDPPNLSSSARPSCAANVHALPVELLEYIFTLCTLALEKPLGVDSRPSHSRGPAWLPITHVCHQWRTIALSYGPLWTSITSRLSFRWIKALMERSQTVLMDFDLLDHRHKDIILLLSDFTRVRSLRFKGNCHTICPILDSLRSPLPVHSFSLHVRGYGREGIILSGDLFGGMAPIRCIQFDSDCRIVVPHCLLHGVTHFTTTEPISPSDLVDVLRQMPALTHLHIRPCFRATGADISPIQMPQLRNVIAHTDFDLDNLLLLNQLLLLQPGARRRLEVHLSIFYGWLASVASEVWSRISPLLEAVDGIQHIHLSGEYDDGWFRMWTGSAATTWEDAEFCLFMEWNRSQGSSRRPMARRFVEACGALGVARARRLVVHLTAVDRWEFLCKHIPSDLSKTYWWDLLEKLPGIEELDLYPTGVGESSGRVWEVSATPAVLPSLRRVRIVDPELELHEYAIIGDPPARRIVRFSNTTEGDITSLPETVSAVMELGNLSSGLLKFVRGLAG